MSAYPAISGKGLILHGSLWRMSFLCYHQVGLTKKGNGLIILYIYRFMIPDEELKKPEVLALRDHLQKRRSNDACIKDVDVPMEVDTAVSTSRDCPYEMSWPERTKLRVSIALRLIKVCLITIITKNFKVENN